MKDLSVQESEQIFTQIMSGKMPEADIAEFLLTLKNKGETADEILGAVKALWLKGEHSYQAISHSVFNDIPILDVCGTGGDGLNTLNISTAVAFVVAGTGTHVAKHGNKAISSKSGSADVLSELGINISTDIKKIEDSLIKNYMGFYFAPDFYPAMKTVASIRKKLNTKTIFNLLGPLLNPAGSACQLIGVYDAKYLRIFAEVLQKRVIKKAWIVHGENGLDEISISGETQVAELDNGAIDIFTITPEDAGLKRYPLEDIKGGDAKYNAAAITRLLDGESGAYQEIVLLNSAAALLVAGKAENLIDGVRLARESLKSKKAKQVLENLKNL